VKFKVLGTILLVFLAAAVVSVIYYWRTDQQVANYYLNNFIEFPIHKEKPIYPTPVDSEQTGTLSGHVEIGPLYILRQSIPNRRGPFPDMWRLDPTAQWKV